MRPFQTFVQLLSFNRESRNWSGFQSAQTNGLTGLLTITEVTGLDSLKGLVDLCDQFSFPIPSPELKRPIRFGRGPISNIGFRHVVLLQILQGFTRFPEKFVFPTQQLITEILRHKRVHKTLVISRTIVVR